MKPLKRAMCAAGLVVAGAMAGLGQQAAAPGDLNELRRQVAEQQRQIEVLREQLSKQAQLLDRLLAEKAEAAAPVVVNTPAPVKAADAAPASEWKVGAVRLKPGGFLDLGFVVRTKNMGSGVPTQFGAVPFGDTAAGQLSDVRFTAQNSRLSLAGETEFGTYRLKAYVETDFLGAAPANLAVTSNSGTLRMRQYWARIGEKRWELLGGQAWSLLTPNRRGLDPEPHSVFTPVHEDPNYMTGFVWGRDPQVRLVLKPGAGFSLGFSLEAAEQYSAGVVALPAALASSYASQINAGAGNLAAPTVMPDMIFKGAWDGLAAGRKLHMEAAGLARAFRVYNPLTSQHFTAPGYGGTWNANVEVARGLVLVANTYASHGGGRYVFGMGPDMIALADGSLRPVGAYAGLGGFEYTRPAGGTATGASTTFFGYYGGTYFRRETAFDRDGSQIGFGYAGSPSTANRSVQQVSTGVNRTLWRSPQYGGVRVLTQWSWLGRSPWWMPAGRPRSTSLGMVFVGLRYELP